MLYVTREHLERFKQIKELFYSKTKVPLKNNWRSRTNNEIWLEIVAQVVVVGRSEPWDGLKENDELRDKIAYENLVQIKSLEELRSTINHVLLEIGTRYVSSDVSKSMKAKALAHNLNVLKRFEQGPREFMMKLAEMKGPDNDKIRIRYVMDCFMYIKNKGARDLLMELGLVKNAIALDARIQAIFQKVGIQMPKISGDLKLYEEIENEILTKICKPLGLLGIEFDRMLYQNKKEIMKMIF
jgi:hypothetical protein